MGGGHAPLHVKMSPMTPRNEFGSQRNLQRTTQTISHKGERYTLHFGAPPWCQHRLVPPLAPLSQPGSRHLPASIIGMVSLLETQRFMPIKMKRGKKGTALWIYRGPPPWAKQNPVLQPCRASDSQPGDLHGSGLLYAYAAPCLLQRPPTCALFSQLSSLQR